MPERYLKVKWPDEEIQNIYSPSSIIDQYFDPGDHMTVANFLKKSTEALNHASDRVQQVYGYACTSAMASIDSVAKKGTTIKDHTQEIEVLDIS